MAGGVVDRLTAIVGAAHVLTDPEVTAGYVRDWTGRFVGHTPAVVRPADTAEVAAVLACCHEEGIAVVPQGGNTGLVGGGVPLGGEIVLSLRRLDGVEPVDEAAAQVTASAGVTIATLRAAAMAVGLDYGVDLAARDTATVGGTVATNAGGLHVVRYGPTRAQLVGYEAVLADGRVLAHLGGLVKDNTGYDLGGLFCGSEGTLAVLTRARLRLVPILPHRVLAFVVVATLDDAVAAVAMLRSALPNLHALELVLADTLDLVVGEVGPPPVPVAGEAVLLVEVADRQDPADRLAEVVGDLPGVCEVAVATDAHRAAGLWAYRERIPEAVNRLGPPVKLDVTVPVARIAEFCRAVRSRVERAAPGSHTWLFGHAGDGNVHVNVSGAERTPVEDVVFGLVAEHRGSISAEHGIGSAKRSWLHLCRSPAEIATFRALKDALDPRGILNPGVLLPPA